MADEDVVQEYQINDLVAALNKRASSSRLVFNVRDYGAKGDGVTPDNSALRACFQAATAAKGVAFLPPGDYVVSGTLSLSGIGCSIVGSWATSTGSADVSGTVFKAVNQTGPVLDFQGFVWPKDYSARLFIGQFAIEGDGTAGVAKRGMSVTGTTQPIGVRFADINVIKTGGVGFYAKDMYCAVVDNIGVTTPVGCVANNVPYVHLIGTNGTIYRGFLLRSTNFDAATADVPALGAWRMEASDSWQHHLTKVDCLTLENFHVPTDGAIIISQTNEVVMEDPLFFDCFKVTGATNTSHARYENSTILNAGSNEWRGAVPGKGTHSNSVDYGITLSQSYNRVVGTKGYVNNNVLLTNGVAYSYCELGGAVSAGNGLGFVDQSGQTTNTLIDNPMGKWVIGGRAGTVGVKINGGKWIGAPMIDAGTLTGATAAINLNGTNALKYTLGANVSFTSVSGTPGIGEQLTLMIAQDATGGRTMTLPATFKWAGGAAPTLSTAAGKVDIFVFMWDGAAWRETSRTMGT